MRKQIILYAMLCLVLLMASCGKDAEYAKVIPADVDLVATADCQRILNESQFLSSEENESKNQFIESVKRKFTADETQLFNQFLANPNDVGVDWSKKVYAFVQAESGIGAIVLPVLDAEKLKSSLLTIAGSKIRGHKFSDQDGFAWAPGRHFYLAVNATVCLFIVADGNEKPDALKQTVSLWLSQNKKDSFVSSEYYAKLLDLDGEVGLYASMQHLPENISMMANMAYSEDMDMSSIKYLADISFEKGKVVAEGKMLYEDSKMRDWIQKQGEACKKLEANSLSYLPKNTPLWFGIGLDGNDLYDRLLEHPTYGQQLQGMSLPLDIEGVIRSIDGDLSISYPHGLFVDVKNDEILRICVGAIKTMGRFIGMDLKETKKNEYELVDEQHSLSRWLNIDTQLSMGMKDDSFYLLTNSNGTSQLTKEESLLSSSWASEVDDNLLFLAFNFQNGGELVDKYSASRRKSKAIQDYFSYVTYSQKDIETNTIVVSLIDQERNVLEQLLEFYFKRF